MNALSPVEVGIGFRLNGRPVVIDAPPATRLSRVLRENLGLTGTKVAALILPDPPLPGAEALTQADAQALAPFAQIVADMARCRLGQGDSHLENNSRFDEGLCHAAPTRGGTSGFRPRPCRRYLRPADDCGSHRSLP